MSRPLAHRSAVLVLASVVLMWGLTWVATKIIVQHVAPFWVTGIRCAIASLVLLGMLVYSRQFVLPRRGDVPVILSIALLHLVAFSTLVNFGLQLVPLGRSIVLGYTVPLWVTPGAALLLGERMTRGQSLGVALGLAGLGSHVQSIGVQLERHERASRQCISIAGRRLVGRQHPVCPGAPMGLDTVPAHLLANIAGRHHFVDYRSVRRRNSYDKLDAIADRRTGFRGRFRHGFRLLGDGRRKSQFAGGHNLPDPIGDARGKRLLLGRTF